jgi:hypothetical protein
MDSDLDTPKDQQVANGENPPKSDILEDDPNLKDKELDNFKKYEDDVDASTRKKMEDDADAEVQKGPDHDSKTKALVLARIIAETNDQTDTPVSVLLGELASLKVMKGVDGFGKEPLGAPGEFRIVMFGSKYTVDPKYNAGNTNENPEENDNFNLRPVEEKEAINNFRKEWPDSSISNNDIIYAKENNLITAKLTSPNLKFGKLQFKIVDGKIIFKKKQKFPLAVEFVLNENGDLVLGEGHYFLSGEKPYLKGAGQMIIDENGKIDLINSYSGHYRPNKDELLTQAKNLRSLGITTNKIYITETPIPIEQLNY